MGWLAARDVSDAPGHRSQSHAAALRAIGGEELQALFLRWKRGSGRRVESNTDSALSRVECGGDLLPSVSRVKRAGRSRVGSNRSGNEAGLFLGGIEHAEAGKVYGPVPCEARHQADVWRGSGVRYAHGPHQGCAVLDEGDGCAVDAPHLSGSSAALEAVSGEQSEICLSDHAGAAGISEAAGSLVASLACVHI